MRLCDGLCGDAADRWCGFFGRRLTDTWGHYDLKLLNGPWAASQSLLLGALVGPRWWNFYFLVLKKNVF